MLLIKTLNIARHLPFKEDIYLKDLDLFVLPAIGTILCLMEPAENTASVEYMAAWKDHAHLNLLLTATANCYLILILN